MNISMLDYNFIELFDTYYTAAEYYFDVSPVDATAQQQKKIRKWITRSFLSDESFPTKVQKLIDGNVSNRDFFRLLKACHDHVAENGTHKKQLFDNFSAELPQDIRSALWSLFDRDMFIDSIQNYDGCASIDIDDFAGFKRNLILYNVSGLPDGDYDCLSFESGSLVKDEGEYRLIGQSISYEDDTSRIFAIRFNDAKVEVSICKSFSVGYLQIFGCSPWQLLSSAVHGIIGRYQASEDYLNDREKSLLPLILEIEKLFNWISTPK